MPGGKEVLLYCYRHVPSLSRIKKTILSIYTEVIYFRRVKIEILKSNFVLAQAPYSEGGIRRYLASKEPSHEQK